MTRKVSVPGPETVYLVFKCCFKLTTLRKLGPLCPISHRDSKTQSTVSHYPTEIQDGNHKLWLVMCHYYIYLIFKRQSPACILNAFFLARFLTGSGCIKGTLLSAIKWLRGFPLQSWRPESGFRLPICLARDGVSAGEDGWLTH
jgi:hypothetical protein